MLDKNDFEKSYSEYIDGSMYDHAEEELFKLIRKAYMAGWKDCEKQNVKNAVTAVASRKKKNKII